MYKNMMNYVDKFCKPQSEEEKEFKQIFELLAATANIGIEPFRVNKEQDTNILANNVIELFKRVKSTIDIDERNGLDFVSLTDLSFDSECLFNGDIAIEMVAIYVDHNTTDDCDYVFYVKSEDMLNHIDCNTEDFKKDWNDNLMKLNIDNWDSVDEEPFIDLNTAITLFHKHQISLDLITKIMNAEVNGWDEDVYGEIKDYVKNVNVQPK